MKKLFLAIIIITTLPGCAAGETIEIPVVDAESFSDSVIKIELGKKTGLDEFVQGWLLVYTSDGDVIETAAEDVVFQRNGSVSVGGESFDGLYGIMLNQPEASVADCFDHTVSALEQQDRIMVIYLDGFGYGSFEWALEQGLIPVMADYSVSAASCVYPTITPVNYAAMVTGEVPKQSGVTARGIHTLSCGSIFDYALENGKSSLICEGDSQILRFSVFQELNPDLNGDGSTDDEVVACALEKMSESEYDLVFIHLHGIDDVSHATGPRSQETLAKIAESDEYVRLLTENWQGRVIITSDHGQHDNDGSGDPEYADRSGTHGSFMASDILVPFIIR